MPQVPLNSFKKHKRKYKINLILPNKKKKKKKKKKIYNNKKKKKKKKKKIRITKMGIYCQDMDISTINLLK